MAGEAIPAAQALQERAGPEREILVTLYGRRWRTDAYNKPLERIRQLEASSDNRPS
jgi:hypothetical protein